MSAPAIAPVPVPVYLSKAPKVAVSNPTRYFIQVDSYRSGECKVKARSYFRMQSKPPARKEGEKVKQDGLTKQAASKIKLACRTISAMDDGFSSFLTLTFGQYWPNDDDAKAILANFLKRLKRHFTGVYGHAFQFNYVWVAERQKRGAIHFHVCFPEWVSKAVVNAKWNAVVSKWQKAQGHEMKPFSSRIKWVKTDNGYKVECVSSQVKPFYPSLQWVASQIKAVENAGGYMAKYMSKEGCKIDGNLYAISQPLHREMKPETSAFEVSSLSDANQHVREISESIANLGFHRFVWTNEGGQVGTWAPNFPVTQLNELIKTISNGEPKQTQTPVQTSRTRTQHGNRPIPTDRPAFSAKYKFHNEGKRPRIERIKAV